MQQNPGKSSCHLQFFPPLPFVASSDELVAPRQTVGEALLLQALLRSTSVGIKKTLACVYWWHCDILSLLFHSAEDCSSFFCCNSVMSQTKEAQTKSIVCSSWVSFLFLSQSSSAKAAQAQAKSSLQYFVMGKKMKPKNRKI